MAPREIPKLSIDFGQIICLILSLSSLARFADVCSRGQVSKQHASASYMKVVKRSHFVTSDKVNLCHLFNKTACIGKIHSCDLNSQSLSLSLSLTVFYR